MMKDRERRIEYLRKYRASGKGAESQRRYLEKIRQGISRCPCGKPSVALRGHSPACADCLVIEARVDSWGSTVSHGVEYREYESK